jgi:DNA-binding NtrC family response regulator
MKTSMAFNRDIKTVDMLAARADLSGPRVSLLIHCRDGVQVVPLVPERRTIVGRGLPSDILIQEPSLSRQHAHFTLEEGQVWVEDLDSTNGTRVNGRVVNRCAISPADVVMLGGVTICVHVLSPGEGPQWVLSGHDSFVPELENELARTKTFGRQLGLLMVRPARRSPGHLSRWCPRVQRLLRPFDRIALYSTDDVEIFLPETTAAEATKIARAIAEGHQGDEPRLLCGIGVFPESASSAEELIEVTRRAALRASPEHPVQTAPASGVPASERPQPVVADDDVIVRSASMHAIFHTVQRLAETTIPVLISGETGTGKEIVARAIHDSGPRRDKPLRCINCAAIPQQLIESALFGHERGAFTGAEQRTKGVFEEADGGTVLLDEIGELSPAAQGALLRVLETKRITRVGSNREFTVDVRILAATNRNLEKMCEQQAFRWDLLYRLNAMTIKLPPLRERPEEIESLTSHFIRQANRANGCEVWGIEPEALALLCRYNWPGNVRELRNVIERAVVLTRRGAISVDELSERVRAMQLDYRGRRPTTSAPSGEHLAAPPPGQLPSFPVEDHTDVYDLLDIPSVGDDRRAADHTAHDPPASDRPASAGQSGGPRRGREELDFHASVERLQRLLIIMALDRCDGNQARAARWLGLPLRTMFYKIKAFDLRERQPSDEERQAAAALGSRWTIEDNFKDWVQAHEATLIREALIRAGGNKAEAARQLRIAHRTLSSKIKQYGIES